jgi:hypothetical protein
MDAGSGVGSAFSGIHAVVGANGQPGHLADKDGNVVILHGVDESGSENFCLTWDPPPSSCHLPAGGANYQDPIAWAVDLILSTNSMHVILDLHITAAGTAKALQQAPTADVDHSVTFWQQVAAAYKGNGSVIFDLFNEPNLPGDEQQQFQCSDAQHRLRVGHFVSQVEA